MNIIFAECVCVCVCSFIITTLIIILLLLSIETGIYIGLCAFMHVGCVCLQTNENSLFILTYIRKGKGKGKAIPLQAWAGPEGSRRLRFPDFKTVGT